MSKLNIDQKSILSLFSDKKADFLIPDYQRPYAWSDKECQRLWDDIFEFAIPENGRKEFDSNAEYFLGPIVTFKNPSGKSEVIDGQQRLTTLMLLLRAFYSRFNHMQDPHSVKTRETISECIWKTDEFGNPDLSALKIDSEVASDDEKAVFLNILRTGDVGVSKGRYADNYRFFSDKIKEFLNDYPSYFAHLPMRILKNCILLPIEAESQDTALRIFSTLNDRGKPLSDADIFKAQFYKHYTAQGTKDEFIRKWKSLEEVCDKIFQPIQGTPMDEVFTQYMYYERALKGIKSSTTEALRKFYEKDSYALLRKEGTFANLIDLADFWKSVEEQDEERFSDNILRKLFVLNYAPNGMWAYAVSVYYLKNRDGDKHLSDVAFGDFLDRITAFILAYALIHPGVNQLRTPVYSEMVKIVNGINVDFFEFRFDRDSVVAAFRNYTFTNGRPITKSLLVWWLMLGTNQVTPSLDQKFEIEHLVAKERQNRDKVLSDSRKIESLGNKAILEKSINIRASEYKFADKLRYYKGFTTEKGKRKGGTLNGELLRFANERTDFLELDIDERFEKMLNRFIDFLAQNDLLK